jgi:ATP-dependent Lon protease
MEVIHFQGYTPIEKFEIAKRHLLPKAMKAVGIKEDQLSITDEALEQIISDYTREAGVRGLKKRMDTLCRTAAVQLVRGEGESLTVEPDKLREYLDMAPLHHRQVPEKAKPGVVTGLAYTEFGGDILPIEVPYFQGKGGLVLTGKLGDVMKESATIALDFVRANANKYGIDPKLFQENDIHIHVPEGAVPKDGPSAGVAMTTALISCLTGTKVDANVAMTGEVTLRGKALPIGGLREKSLAALRSGIKTIIVPEENRKDVSELPVEVKDNLKIVFMKCVDDALAVALVSKQA